MSFEDDTAKPWVGTANFKTRAVDLGTCFFRDLDNAWDVIAEAEEQWDYRVGRFPNPSAS